MSKKTKVIYTSEEGEERYGIFLGWADDAEQVALVKNSSLHIVEVSKEHIRAFKAMSGL